jgi:glucans biosynthesis protein
MHGGSKGSGAPDGNQNALKDGVFTREAITERRALNKLLHEIRETLKEFDGKA